MTLKPNAAVCRIAEQIVEDPASGLTLQFERLETGQCRVLIAGPLPLGNRELIFNEHGEFGGAGTAVGGICRPSWLRAVD